MTRPARNSLADDEARWAEAQSILDRTPTESADRRLRRAKRLRWLLVVGVVLLTVVVALLVVLLVGDSGPDDQRSEEVTTWQTVTGLTISGVGILFMAVALVVHFRRMRRIRGWRSPMYVLTRRQQRDLLKQVRGQAPVVPERLPLARHLAELLLLQWVLLAVQAGLLVNFAGAWIVGRDTWRLGFVGGFAVLLLVAAVFVRRENRRARRFLDEHPMPAGG